MPRRVAILGRPRVGRLAFALAGPALALALAGCDAGPPPATPPIVPGSSASPREVNLITKDYSYLPDVLDLAPGETVLLHIINGGLATHEAVIGDPATQAAWADAEAGTDQAPPGPTPVVSVPPGVAGLRVVVASGQLVDVVWTVPADAADTGPYTVECHIPGHLERGMAIPVRWAPAP